MTALPLARVAAAAAALALVAGCAPAAAGASPRAGHNRHGGTAADSPKAIAAGKAGVDATLAYNQTVGTAVLGFAADLEELSTALAAGDLPAAKADELAAQGRFDVVRFLGSSGLSAGSGIDGLADDVPAGQRFSGLHLVERDLWAGGGDPATAVSALQAQAPLIEESFLRLRESPEAIVSIAVKELGWVNEVAIPGREEPYSHLDSVDVAATVDAAHDAFMDVAPLGRIVAPRRVATVTRRFAALLAAVAVLGPPGTVVDASVPAAEWQAVAQDDDAAAAALGALEATLAGYGPRQIYGYNA